MYNRWFITITLAEKAPTHTTNLNLDRLWDACWE